MSNQTVGAVYQQIIQDVIDSSRVDFEEGGVEEAVLEELRKGWQQKLSSMKVAQFPWDPKPEPPAPAPAATAAVASQPAPTNAPTYTQAQLSPPSNALPLPLPAQPAANQNGAQGHVKPEPAVKNEPVIKQEPGLQNGSMPPVQNYNAAGVQNVAAQRAISQLSSQFGSRAAASISALHNQGRPQQGPAPGQLQQPMPGQQYQRMNPQQQQQHHQHQQQQQQQQQQRPPQSNGQNGFAQSQMDGTADLFEGVLMERSADGTDVELGRVEIDRMLHEKIAARAKQMEGGGLMVPLKQATKHSSSRSKRTAGASQFDGIDDDIKDEEDDEAINSDLDDPEDDQDGSEDDDDSMGHIMLCMYDKVQRVKNKWKCTLKDGVLTVNGKEYVFHKATGEYEW